MPNTHLRAILVASALHDRRSTANIAKLPELLKRPQQRGHKNPIPTSASLQKTTQFQGGSALTRSAIAQKQSWHFHTIL